MDDALRDRLGAGKYLLLTSYRKNGTPVATPVWVVRDGEHLAIWTERHAGKVKRIRRDGTPFTVLNRKVELELRHQVEALTHLYRDLDAMHDFVHELYPAGD